MAKSRLGASGEILKIFLTMYQKRGGGLEPSVIYSNLLICSSTTTSGKGGK